MQKYVLFLILLDRHPRIQLLGCMGSPFLSLKNLPNYFPEWVYYFTPHQQRMSNPVCPHPCQYLVLPLFSILWQTWYHYAVNLNLPKVNDVEHFIMCLFSISISPLMKCLFMSLNAFFNWILFFLLLHFESSLCILFTQILWWVCDLQIFCPQIVFSSPFWGLLHNKVFKFFHFPLWNKKENIIY